MKALVVYESFFGNTRAVARAVADGLASRMDVELVDVGSAPARIDEDVDLLVVGGPTHAFGMSRPGTREDAVNRGGDQAGAAADGLREWLESASGHARTAAAAFDTHIHKPRVPGSAARGARKRLRRLGLRIVAKPESFYVTDTSGQLLDGEIERAQQWAAGIAAALAGR